MLSSLFLTKSEAIEEALQEIDDSLSHHSHSQLAFQESFVNRGSMAQMEDKNNQDDFFMVDVELDKFEEDKSNE